MDTKLNNIVTLIFFSYFLLMVVNSEDHLCPCGTREYDESVLKTYIVQGQKVEDKKKYPWMVTINLLREDLHMLCGGALISSRFVLTAAHCLLKECSPLGGKFCYREPDTIVVGVSKTTSAKPDKSLHFVQFILYPEQFSWSHDITLLKTKTHIPCTEYTRYACLGIFDVPISTKLIMAGWGDTNFEETTNNLFEGSMTTTNTSVCSQFTTKYDPENIYCMKSDKNQQSPCYGDSGSPVFYEEDGVFYVVGIWSKIYDTSCPPKNIAVAMKVSRFLTFIQTNIRSLPQSD